MSPPLDSITIPASMLPADGRFGCGPSKVRPEAAQALAARAVDYLGTSHRKSGVRSVVGELRAGLAQLLNAPAGYEVLLGNGGATAFWDAASFCLIERRSHHLSLGEFSSKFVAVTSSAPHLAEPSVTVGDFGTCPPLKSVPDVDTYCYPHNETSTGVMVEVRRPGGGGPDGPASSGGDNSSERLGGSGGVTSPASSGGSNSPEGDDKALVLVDATSAAGGLRFDATAADAYYFAPQKALSSDGGIWMALMSPAAIERIERISASGRWTPAFLDLKLALDNSRKDQTYNTPALATVFVTAQQVNWINSNGGLEWAASRSDRSAEIIYGWATASEIATPFVVDIAARSHVVATIDFDSRVSADAISAVLRANGIVDTDGYRKLGRNQLRIGMFPAVDPDDIQALTNCIDYIAERLI